MCPSIFKGTLQYFKGAWKIKKSCIFNELNYIIIKIYNIQNFILLLNPDFMDTGDFFNLFIYFCAGWRSKKSILGKLLR